MASSRSNKPSRSVRVLRLESTLSEEETYGRLVDQRPASNVGNSQPTSPRSLSEQSSLGSLSLKGAASLSASEGLWQHVLGGGVNENPGGAHNPVWFAHQQRLNEKATSTSRFPGSPTMAEVGENEFEIMRYDRSPVQARHSLSALAALAGPDVGERQRQGSISNTEVIITAKAHRMRRVSSVLNTFTCDLVATDIEYEVPIPQPSRWSKAGEWAREKGRQLGHRCYSSSCCSRSDSYDVDEAPDVSDQYDSDQQPPRAAPRRARISEDRRWRKILNHISIDAQPGKMIAILGGSGSGKTSLLDVLSGRSPPEGRVSGKMTINEVEVQRSSEELKSCVGYVTQGIFLLPNLTVEETLQFVSFLRLPRDFTDFEKRHRVCEVLQYLGLEPLAQRLVGGEESKGLSGGQQRLVAIAMQMIYNPGVLILDEPTSGLDSYTAEHVCKTLHDLAMRRSRAILLTIHQPGPEITQLFDHVVILSSGHTVYNGPADTLVRYFNSLGYTLPEFTNPCDYYVDLATLDTRSSVREQHSRSCFDFLVNAFTDFKDKLWELDEESEDEDNQEEVVEEEDGETYRIIPALTPKSHGKRGTSFATTSMIQRRRSQFISHDSQVKVLPTPPEGVNGFVKFGILLRRTMHNELRDSTELINQFAQALLLSILFGLVFIGLGEETTDLRNRKAVLFISFSLYPFMAVFETIAKYAGQQMMMFHEMVNGLYTTTPLGVAKIVGELPVSLLLTIPYTIPLYFMSSLRVTAVAYFKFLLLTNLLVQISRLMALAASIITQSPNYAALAANLLFTGWILTAGYIININNLWPGVQWVAFVSPVRYAFQGAAITELEGRSFSSDNTTAPLRGSADLENLAFDTLTFTECVGIMLAMYGGMVAIVLVALHLRRNARPD